MILNHLLKAIGTVAIVTIGSATASAASEPPIAAQHWSLSTSGGVNAFVQRVDDDDDDDNRRSYRRYRDRDDDRRYRPDRRSYHYNDRYWDRYWRGAPHRYRDRDWERDHREYWRDSDRRGRSDRRDWSGREWSERDGRYGRRGEYDMRRRRSGDDGYDL